MTQTDYQQAVRDTRNALRYWKQTRTYTKAHFEAWCELAQDLYPDTNECLYADLRNAFVHGCLMGYECAIIFDAPSCYDRLQSDAYLEGVQHGENVWMSEHED